MFSSYQKFRSSSNILGSLLEAMPPSPDLLGITNELKAKIIANLDPYSRTLGLRIAHPDYYALVAPIWNDRHRQCRLCAQVLPPVKIADDMYAMHALRRFESCPSLDTSICIHCGASNRVHGYGRGSLILVQGKRYVLWCNMCCRSGAGVPYGTRAYSYTCPNCQAYSMIAGNRLRRGR